MSVIAGNEIVKIAVAVALHGEKAFAQQYTIILQADSNQFSLGYLAEIVTHSDILTQCLREIDCCL